MDELISLDHKSKLQIHISVPMSINDTFYRRKTEYVVGTLLGLVYPDHIEITNSYPIPLQDIDPESGPSIVIDTDHHEVMFKLNQKVYPQEIVVGFYSTSLNIDLDTVMLNHLYSQKEKFFIPQGLLQQPIYLSMDPMNSQGSFGIKTYCNVQLTNLRDSFSIFQEIPHSLSLLNFTQQEGKKIILVTPILYNKKSDNLKIETFKDLKINILQSIAGIVKYLKNKVISQLQDKKPDEKQQVLTNLNKILNMIPQQKKDQEDLKQATLQDVSLINYLSNLAKAQTVVSEKINKI